jgi:dihydropteroate synthase
VHWQTARFRVDLTRPIVMGIVNLTPDSFFDGGQHAAPADAVRHCERLVGEGADMLDLGAESTRPGAVAPTPWQEWERLAPVLSAAVTLGVPISVDTSTPEVMQRALDRGADAVNDVRALMRDGALAAMAAHPSAGVCLMHMRGEPGTMQDAPSYGDVVGTVRDFLRDRLTSACAAGIDASRIVLDPGIGFGKSPAHNIELLRRQDQLRSLGRPLLVGWSRKSTLGALTGRPVQDRQVASVTAALLAVQRGAAIVRVHDVAATVDALRVWEAVAGLKGGAEKGSGQG